MIDLCIILIIALCGTAYAHLRIAQWKSKYRTAALAFNQLLTLIYIPVLINQYWKFNDTGQAFFSRHWMLRLIIFSILIMGFHFYVSIKIRLNSKKSIVTANWLAMLCLLMTTSTHLFWENYNFDLESVSTIPLIFFLFIGFYIGVLGYIGLMSFLGFWIVHGNLAKFHIYLRKFAFK